MVDVYEHIVLAEKAYHDFQDPALRENDPCFVSWIPFSSKIVAKETIPQLENFFDGHSNNIQKGSYCFNKGKGWSTITDGRLAEFNVHKRKLSSKHRKEGNAECGAASKHMKHFDETFLPLLTICEKCFPEQSVVGYESVTETILALDKGQMPEPKHYIVAMNSPLSNLIKATYLQEIKTFSLHTEMEALIAGKANKKLRKQMLDGKTLNELSLELQQEAQHIVLDNEEQRMKETFVIDYSFMLLWESLNVLQQKIVAFNFGNMNTETVALNVTSFEKNELNLSPVDMPMAGMTFRKI